MQRKLNDNALLDIVLRNTYIPPYLNTDFIHSAIPLLYKSKPNLLVKGKFALHEGAKLFAPFVSVLPTIESLNYLGYTSVQVRELIKNLQHYPNPLTFIGLGGINNGIVYWLIKLGELVDNPVMKEISITVYDGDDWALRNMPRVHFLSQSDEGNKAQWLHQHNKVTRDIGRVNAFPYMMSEDDIAIIKNTGSRSADRDVTPLIIGAPDSTMRTKLTQSKDCNYLFVGQYQQRLNMWINPVMKSKSVDSYGWVDANMFPLVTLKATLELLKVLPKTKNAKCTERKVCVMDFSKFVEAHDPLNLFGIIPSSMKWSSQDGFRPKAKGE